jgi:hypothetical protein
MTAADVDAIPHEMFHEDHPECESCRQESGDYRPPRVPYETARFKWDYDDLGVLCRFDKEEQSWTPIEPCCVDCGHRDEDCACKEETPCDDCGYKMDESYVEWRSSEVDDRILCAECYSAWLDTRCDDCWKELKEGETECCAECKGEFGEDCAFPHKKDAQVCVDCYLNSHPDEDDEDYPE